MVPASRAARRLSAFAFFIAAFAASTSARADSVCTLLADGATGAILFQDGACDERVPPASTFKIPISLMGYDAGFLKDESLPVLPFKQGYPDWIEAWRRDTGPSAWMKESVVWYSQQVTRALGADRFAGYVSAFDYGNADVSGDAGKDNGLTRSWLSSSLRISPAEQIGFLKKLVGRELPVSAHAYEMTEAILGQTALPGGWTIQGKTGTGFAVNADGKADRSRPFGWYVGWARGDGRVVLFVRLKQADEPQKMTPGLGARDQLLAELPDLLGRY